MFTMFAINRTKCPKCKEYVQCAKINIQRYALMYFNDPDVETCVDLRDRSQRQWASWAFWWGQPRSNKSILPAWLRDPPLYRSWRAGRSQQFTFSSEPVVCCSLSLSLAVAACLTMMEEVRISWSFHLRSWVVMMPMRQKDSIVSTGELNRGDVGWGGLGTSWILQSSPDCTKSSDNERKIKPVEALWVISIFF